MEDPVRIYIVGTAGCGKSTLVQAFKLWMDENGLTTTLVNLDPGVEGLGYTPDVDVRDWVSVSEVMAEHGLGPNGAQIACADMTALQFPEIAEVIEGFRSDYILIDTPGQIELFAFRKASEVFLSSFSGQKCIIVFVLDPFVAKVPAGLVSLLMLSSSVEFRFQQPIELILGKANLLEIEELDLILNWCRNPELLMDALEQGEMNMRSVAAVEFLRSVESLQAHINPIPISSLELQGFEDLYNTVQLLFEGGEDLQPD